MNYNGKLFRAVSNTENGETSSETLFRYEQDGAILSSTYAGGRIVKGHLIGLVDDAGNIDMRYHQMNDQQELMTGMCRSVPQVLANGKIRLHEYWKWTSGDGSEVRSTLEEV